MSRNKSEEWPTTPDDIGMTKPSERAVSPVPSLDNVSVLEAKNALVSYKDSASSAMLGAPLDGTLKKSDRQSLYRSNVL